MKKILRNLIPLLLFFLIANGMLAAGLSDAFGDDTLNVVANDSGYATDINNNSSSIEGIVGITIQSLIALLGTIFIIIIIWAGHLWMTASGNDEKVSKAKKLITESIIGLTLVLTAYALSDTIISLFVKFLK